MQTRFKRHQNVRLLRDPDPEYIEYDPEYYESRPQIKAGMTGKVNIILSNGQYHVKIIDKNNNIIAYVKVDEDSLESD